MEIEGFNEVVGIITIAKELHDIGRHDIIQSQFFDIICYDSWLEDMLGVISSVFSGFCSDYDEGDETEKLIFTDDIIGNYFCHAWEFGKKTKTPYNKNPFVEEAEFETRRWLGFTHNMNWKLLGYTKTKRAARKSKLIVYTCAYEFGEHDHLAYGLIQLYKWFSDKCAEFSQQKEVTAA